MATIHGNSVENAISQEQKYLRERLETQTLLRKEKSQMLLTYINLVSFPIKI